MIVPSAQKVCFAILVTGIRKPTDVHIHRGGPGVAGPVVVPLAPPASGNPGAVAGCVTGPRAVLRDIANRPGRYYVNVHTGDYPGGALRGQLFAR